MRASLWCAIAMLCFGVGCQHNQAGISTSLDPARIQRYFEFNQIAPHTLKPGMTRDDVYAILGPPTGQNGKGMESWYHNLENLHVAPYIRIKFDGEVALAVYSGRG